MNYERAILVSFLGNYLINNIVAAIVALFGFAASGNTTMQYATYIVLAGVFAALVSWWYLKRTRSTLMDGAIFGGIAFAVAVITALVSGISSVVAQTGSLGQLAQVLPNFVPFIFNWTTLAILAYWLIPAVVVAWLLTMKKTPAVPPSAPRPMI